MEFREVINDPTAQALAERILAAANLDAEPGETKAADAYRIRTEAADDLALVIAIAAECGETISAPIADLLNPVSAMAYNVEKPKTATHKTREIAKVAVLGHILIGRLRQAQARPFNVAMALAAVRVELERLIEAEMTRKLTPGFNSGSGSGCEGDCDCGSGGGGGCGGSGGCGGCGGGHGP